MVQNMDHLIPVCSSSVEGEGATTFLVEEYD
jgi:hypothetical protein